MLGEAVVMAVVVVVEEVMVAACSRLRILRRAETKAVDKAGPLLLC